LPNSVIHPHRVQFLSEGFEEMLPALANADRGNNFFGEACGAPAFMLR
jgi:hypothetical protein